MTPGEGVPLDNLGTYAYTAGPLQVDIDPPPTVVLVVKLLILLVTSDNGHYVKFCGFPFAFIHLGCFVGFSAGYYGTVWDGSGRFGFVRPGGDVVTVTKSRWCGSTARMARAALA